MIASSPPTSRIVILAAVDSSQASSDVVTTSSTLGQALSGAELHLVHVVEPKPTSEVPDTFMSNLTALLENGRALLERTAAQAGERFSGRIVSHLVAGTVWSKILQLAADLHADVIVVAPHRKNTVERWVLGSVSEQVMRKASCAVLVARPKDYRSAGAPEIEPACIDCSAIQRKTSGETLWCGRHDHGRRTHGGIHYELPRSFAVGSLLLRPEG